MNADQNPDASRDGHPRQATIYDVAERAGVSHITVSRVVNGKQNVTAETRARVQQAMRELGYAPNPIAKTLQTRRSQTIELVTADIWGSNPNNINSIGSVAQTKGYQFTILPTTKDRLLDALRTIPNRMVAGTILYAQDVDLDVAAVQRAVRHAPFVHMGGKLQSGLPSVTYDHAYGARLATRHLIERGHRQIAFIGGPQVIFDGSTRYEGYLETLAEHGLMPGPATFGNFGAASGAEAMQRLLDSGQQFTAIFICSDQMAVGAYSVLARAGLRVPDDISVVGYDNDNVAPFTLPPLTTLRNDFFALGNAAADYLFELISRPDAPRQQRVLLPDFILRESTGQISK